MFAEYVAHYKALPFPLTLTLEQAVKHIYYYYYYTSSSLVVGVVVVVVIKSPYGSMICIMKLLCKMKTSVSLCLQNLCVISGW